MTLRSSLTPLGLVLVWTAGLLLAIGSKSYDPEDEVLVDPVIVDFSVTNSGTVSVANGSSIDSISSLIISGSFDSGSHNVLLFGFTSIEDLVLGNICS